MTTTSATPSAQKKLISLPLTAALVGIAAVLSFIGYLVAVDVFFGSKMATFAVMLIAFPVVIFCGLFAQSNQARPHISNSFLVAAIGGGAFFAAPPFIVESVRDSESASRVVLVLDRARDNLGQPSPLDAELRAMTTNRHAFAAQRDMLLEIVRSETSQEAVTQYLVSAQLLGVDTHFVAQNAIVRPQDQRALFAQALKKAQAGDSVAAQWLTANPIAAR